MWQNRDHALNLSAATLPFNHVNGCTAYAEENGRDTVYVGAISGGTARNLYRYVINDIANPAADTWERIGGYYGSPSGETTCAFDPVQRLLVRTGNNQYPLLYWNTATPGAKNYEVSVSLSDPDGVLLPLLQSNSLILKKCALDFDPLLRQYLLWCGDGRVWSITPPPEPSASGWTVSLAPAPSDAVPNGDYGTGILGKWKHAADLGVFVGMQDSFLGNVWMYKPVSGANQLPVVNLTAPANGATIAAGGNVTLSASAVDNDGTVTRVEFFAGANKLGESTSAPYEFVWITPPVGSYTLVAKATDNLGGMSVSPAFTLTLAGSNQPPVVALTSPADGATLRPDTFIVVSANATDGDGSIARVAFFEGSRQIGESFALPLHRRLVCQRRRFLPTLIGARARQPGASAAVSAPITRHRQSISLRERRLTLQDGS
jgi:hypothetical protein